MTGPSVVSLCAGYGGLDLALAAVLGAETVLTADTDPGASKILAHRFPGVPNLGDIAAVSWPGVARPDILAAGFPCQDVSCAGGRAGMRAGNRTGVWAHVARAIDELRPPLVVLENVRGLLSAGADSDVEWCAWCLGEAGNEHPLRACGAVLGDLASLGYDARWAVVSAADAGAPHRRERVFIVAWPAADAPDSGRDALNDGSEPRPHGAAPGSGHAGMAGDDRGSRLATADSAGQRRIGHHDASTVNAGRDARDGPRPGDRLAAEDADSPAGSERREPAPGQAAPWRARADAGRPGGARAPADAEGNGRHEGRPESARLVGGPDASECRHAPAADAGRGGLQGAEPASPRPGREAAAAVGRRPADERGPAPAGFFGPGRPDEGFPRLAVGKADEVDCRVHWNGQSELIYFHGDWLNNRGALVGSSTIRVPRVPRPARTSYYSGRALMPLIPPPHRPRPARLRHCHILWEVESWDLIPPRDPALLRHIRGDLWAVLAVWDLSDLERAVLAGRA